VHSSVGPQHHRARLAHVIINPPLSLVVFFFLYLGYNGQIMEGANKRPQIVKAPAIQRGAAAHCMAQMIWAGS
jgi:hypothetical protein